MSDIGQVPASQELEQAVLGAILINPDLRAQVDLSGDDFYSHRHRTIWGAMGRLNGNTDMITLSDELDKAGQLGEIGGPAYLAALITRVGTTLYTEEYALRLRDLSQRRRMLAAANELARIAFDLDASPDTAYALLDQLVTQRPVQGAAQPIRDWVVQAYQEISRRATQEVPDFSLNTGFPDIDALIGGLYPDEGTFFYLAGQPGVGKTILWSNICEHLATQAPGAMYSIEMKRLRLMLRSFSARTGISVWNMRQGKVDEAQLGHLADSLPAYDRMRLFVSDSSEWSTQGLRADLYRLKREHGVRWFAVDYLALINDQAQRSDEWDRVREVSRRLLGICRSLGMACIAIHTLNKEGFNKHAGMSAFSGSAGVMYDADISAYLSDGESKSFAVNGGAWTPIDLNVVKNRDGEGGLGSVTLGRMKNAPRFITPSLTNQPEEKAPWYHK